tara:strand:- start:21582 stop:22196 length:615 start_codon:yes stop_codon:yes gene_type:complete
MAKKASGRQPGSDKVLDAALDLAAAMRWQEITMEMVADAAGASLARVYDLFPSKAALITAFIHRTDRAVLAGHDFDDASEPCRERLLDVLMRRLDALRPHRAAVASITRGIGSDPCAMLCALPAFAGAMAWSLEAAGIRSSGPMGLIRIKGLSLIYLAGLRVWLRDDTQDLSQTMAEIDKRLKRVEALMSALPFGAGRRRSQEG